MAAHGSTTAAHRPRVRPRRRGRSRSPQIWLAFGTVGVAALVVLLGLAFAGSSARLAEGTRIAGVDVGGLTPADARRLLEERARQLAGVPVTFSAGNDRWRLAPKQLGIDVDWNQAVSAAERHGGGFGPVRGYRRLEIRLFDAEVEPPTRVYEPALAYEIDRIAKRLDAPHREARLVRRGLHMVVEPGQVGRALDRAAGEKVIVRALASLERSPVGLPVLIDPPRVTAAQLQPARRLAQRAVSAPVVLTLGRTRYRLPRWRIATILQLPRRAGQGIALRGLAANAYFRRLARTVNRSPRDADFAVYANGVRIVPAKRGVALDVRRSAAAILAAARRPTNRKAALIVSTSQPKLTTAEASAMGIKGVVGAYETIYGGDPNRVHNVQLVAHLVDRKLIAPGSTFSFNATTGERSAEKGFREAPVIINGELQTGLGGGVCQVSTTVFNAAYEAGIPITDRTNHALYISHYPLGRDATVNYPDLDLKFVNDTGHWLLLRTFVGASSLVAALYGTPVHRRVETQTAPLRELASPPVRRVDDPDMFQGETVVEEYGEPSRSTSVRRRVYSTAGKLLSDSTWYSSYRSEPTIVRVGTKARPKPKPPPKATETTTTQTATTTTATTQTETTETTQTTATDSTPTVTTPTPTVTTPQPTGGPH